LSQPPWLSDTQVYKKFLDNNRIHCRYKTYS